MKLKQELEEMSRKFDKVNMMRSEWISIKSRIGNENFDEDDFEEMKKEIEKLEFDLESFEKSLQKNEAKLKILKDKEITLKNVDKRTELTLQAQKI